MTTAGDPTLPDYSAARRLSPRFPTEAEAAERLAKRNQRIGKLMLSIAYLVVGGVLVMLALG